MKVSRIFAGLLIIVLGISLFLSNFDVLTLNWHFIFRLWPILLVFAGISVLVSNSKLKTVLYVITSVLVLLWIFSVASVGWGNFREIFHADGRPSHSQEFTEQLDKDVRHGVLSLSAGAGSFSLSDSTNDLFYAHSESNVGTYSLNADKEGSTEKLDLSFEGNENHWSFGNSKNKVDMKLNPKPDWNLNVDVGACSVDFDLTPYIIRTAGLKAGASSIKVRLGDKSDTTHLSMDAGASTVTIYVPSSSGCEIRDNAQLSSKSFPDFSKSDNGTYRTSNFESSKKKVFIRVEAGVSSIKVRTY